MTNCLSLLQVIVDGEMVAMDFRMKQKHIKIQLKLGTKKRMLSCHQIAVSWSSQGGLVSARSPASMLTTDHQ